MKFFSRQNWKFFPLENQVWAEIKEPLDLSLVDDQSAFDERGKDQNSVDSDENVSRSPEVLSVSSILSQSPLDFSVRKLQFLEDHADEVFSQEEYQFAFYQLAEYFLALGINSFRGGTPPSRIVFRLTTSCPRLFSFLRGASSLFDEEVLKFLEGQKKVLAETLTKNELSPDELLRASEAYDFLSRQGLSKDSEFEPVFAKAKKKILDSAIPLFHRYSYEIDSSDPSKIGRIFHSPDGTSKLSDEEKFVLLQIRSVFFRSSDWGDDRHIDALDAKAQEIALSFSEKFKSRSFDEIFKEEFDLLLVENNLKDFDYDSVSDPEKKQKLLEEHQKKKETLKNQASARVREIMNEEKKKRDDSLLRFAELLDERLNTEPETKHNFRDSIRNANANAFLKFAENQSYFSDLQQYVLEEIASDSNLDFERAKKILSSYTHFEPVLPDDEEEKRVILGSKLVERQKENLRIYNKERSEIGTLLEEKKKEIDVLLGNISSEKDQNIVSDLFSLRKKELLSLETLSEIDLSTRPFFDSVSDISRKIIETLENFQVSARAGERGQKLFESAEMFFDSFEKKSSLLQQRLESIRSLVLEKGGEKFGTLFQKKLDEIYANLVQKFSNFRHYFFDRGSISGGEYFFEDIKESINDLRGICDFRDGEGWKKEKDAVKQDFSGGTESVRLLHKNSFFVDREKFLSEERKKQEKFNALLDQYSEAFGEVQKIIDRDAKSLSDESFSKRYSASKKSFLETLASYKKTEQDIRSGWQKFLDPAFLGAFVSRYDSGDLSLQKNALDDYYQFSRMFDMKKGFEVAYENLRNWLNERKEKYRKNKKENSFSARMKKTEWATFSLRNILDVIKDTWKNYKKGLDDDKTESYARLGVALLGDKGRYGKGFKDKLDGFSKKVEDYEKKYEKAKISELWDIIRTSSDKDLLQATINILNKKGALSWDDALIWNMLNRMQKDVYFEESDRNKTPLEIRDKVKKAIKNIWGESVFDGWNDSLSSNAKIAQEKFSSDFEMYDKDKKHETFIDILKNWKSGNIDKASKAQFEYFLKSVFEKSQLNGYPDLRIYYFIQGMTLQNPQGQTLLGPDVFPVYEKFSEKFPFFAFFSDKDSFKLNGKVVEEGIPGAEKRPWKKEDFSIWAQFLTDSSGSFDPRKDEMKPLLEDFYFSYLHASPKVSEKASKISDISADDAWIAFSEFSFQDLHDELLVSHKKKPSFWRNYFNTLPIYSKQMQKVIVEGDRRWGFNEAWLKQKNKILLEVGQKIKTAFFATQCLAGNYLSGNYQIFQRDEWGIGTEKFPAMEKGRESVNKFIDLLFSSAGLPSSEYKDLFDFYGADYGRTIQELKGQVQKKGKKDFSFENVDDWDDETEDNSFEFKPKLFAITQKAKNILSYAGEKYFKNTEAIEHALQEFCKSF